MVLNANIFDPLGDAFVFDKTGLAQTDTVASSAELTNGFYYLHAPAYDSEEDMTNIVVTDREIRISNLTLNEGEAMTLTYALTFADPADYDVKTHNFYQLNKRTTLQPDPVNWPAIFREFPLPSAALPGITLQKGWLIPEGYDLQYDAVVVDVHTDDTDGQPKKEGVVISAQNNWQTVLTDLPRSEENGDIVYRLVETELRRKDGVRSK